MNGAQILLKSLEKEGVDTIFGYQGGSAIPIFDALFDSDIRIVIPRHEQAAAHAADGYARTTGKVGVCLSTSGPGATNLITGIATAYMDSIPLIAITGQVKTWLIGNDAFQEADILGITRSISKHNYLVKDVKDLAAIIKEAFYLARSGRPGPVVIDLPVDVQMHETEFEYSKEVRLRSYNPTRYGHPGQIRRALKRIYAANQPVIIAGGGVILSDAFEELRTFAQKMAIPVTSTLMGLGAFPDDNNLSLGMPGMHGTAYANLAITESDLLISVGCRFDDRVTGKLDEFAPKAKIIHIDIDPTSISKNVEVDIPVVGDVKNVLGQLIEEIKEKKIPDTSLWLKKIRNWKVKHPLMYKQKGIKKIKPQYVIEEVCRQAKGEAIIATEVGQHQMWVAQFYAFNEPRQLVTSGGLGTMGYGFPAAIGAKIANPEKQVVLFAGDGSIQMNIQELATLKTYGINVKMIILNNSSLGMVRQWQELFFNRRYSGTPLNNPDFVGVAKGYGIKGMRVSKVSEVKSAIAKILKAKEPILAEFVIEPEENVFPMVPAGKAINQMIGGMS